MTTDYASILRSDYESILSRSSTGLRSCKEVLALVKERATIEEAYGTALIKQSRSAAGSLERGTARLGWYAFKSTTENLGRKHLELASHFAADCTALTYLRDRLTSSHKALVAEGATPLRECKATFTSLQRAKARYTKAARELDAFTLQNPSGVALASTSSASRLEDSAPETSTSKPLQMACDVQNGSAAYNECLRHHQEALRGFCGQLPRLLQDFEKVEGHRIDSLKMALKKLLSAQEAMLTAQRPLVYAAADMVDAIDRQDDVQQYTQELHCATRGPDIEQLLEEQARLFSLFEQSGVDGLGIARRVSIPSVPKSSVAATHVKEMDRATKVTSDFLGLSSGEVFHGGLVLQESATGQQLVAHEAMQLVQDREYMMPSDNRVVRISDTELLLEHETRIQVIPPRPAQGGSMMARPDDGDALGAQLDQASGFLRLASSEDMQCVISLRVTLQAPSDECQSLSPVAAAMSAPRPAVEAQTVLEFQLGKAGEALECSLACSPQVFIGLVNGTLSPSTAHIQQLIQTTNLPCLIRLAAHICERERFVAYASEASCVSRKGRISSQAEGSQVVGEEEERAAQAVGGGSGRESHEERSAQDIDNELVQIAKQQMRRMAEEGSDALNAGPANSVGFLMWSVLTSVGSEPTRATLWSNLRNLRSIRGTLPQTSSYRGVEDEPQAQGLDAAELLDVLGGDADLAQGFEFLPQAQPPSLPHIPDTRMDPRQPYVPTVSAEIFERLQAFLGCDWNGHVHISVQHERGVHTMTLAVTPQAARVLEGHSSSHPMLTVSARRDVLLDVLSGKLEVSLSLVAPVHRGAGRRLFTEAPDRF